VRRAVLYTCSNALEVRAGAFRGAIAGMSEGSHEDLVQGEGVNAGSATATGEGRGSGAAGRDVEGGGHPEAAPDAAEGFTGYGATEDDQELAGAPADDPREPSAEHGSSGQDAGSME